MSSETKGPRLDRRLLYAGLVVVILLLGLALGVMALRRWLIPPHLPETTSTATRSPTAVAWLTATPAAGSPTPAIPASTATATPCPPPPAGWLPYTVGPGDTLSELAVLAGVSQEQVMQVNCLASADLLVGQVLYLPPLPTPTPCGAVPAGWVPYTVQAGDTLFGLSSLVGVGQEQVMQVNCLASRELQAGQVLYLPPLPTPTPTPCVASPPPGWVRYAVRSGDTLFSLAVTRGTTTEEVMQVNCLTSAELWAGEEIYLPPLPITYEPPATPSAPPPTEALDCTSAFSCSSTELPTWTVDVAAPGDPLYEPCAAEKNKPWISVITEDLPGDDRNDLKHGWRAHYFACEFADPETLTATMTGPGGARPFDVEAVSPDLDPQDGRLQGRVTWGATCDLLTGTYTLTIESEIEEQAHLTFTLDTASFPRILAVPQTGPPGTLFQVYYCGYDAFAEKEIDIDFWYKTGELPDGKSEFSRATSWTVSINADGWGQKELRSQPDDPVGVYGVRGRRPEIQGTDFVWLIDD